MTTPKNFKFDQNKRVVNIKIEKAFKFLSLNLSAGEAKNCNNEVVTKYFQLQKFFDLKLSKDLVNVGK